MKRRPARRARFEPLWWQIARRTLDRPLRQWAIERECQRSQTRRYPAPYARTP